MSDRNFDVMQTDNGFVRMWTRGVPVEDGALAQLRNVADLPFVRGMAAMPDVHIGMGATIGSVICTERAVMPASVGVDIGCGMQAVWTDLDKSDLPDLPQLRAAIEKAVPHGRTNHGGPTDRGAWGELPEAQQEVWATLEPGWTEIVKRHPKIDTGRVNTARHLGTLGTGNHFIEVCLDEHDRVWIMLHSGSRGVGGRIGMFFTKLAQEDMKRYYVDLVDPYLAFFPEGTQGFDDYLFAVQWAQRFALENRKLIMRQIIAALESVSDHEITYGEPIDCHHNYIAREHHGGRDVWITRKGAVCARKGMLGIIPGSMGERSFITEGLGNKDSYHSCSHGAGRAMSRTVAKRTFTVADHIEATKGVECRKDESVIDETPGAYKDIDAVMAAQEDLVAVRHTLRQVVCVKG